MNQNMVAQTQQCGSKTAAQFAEFLAEIATRETVAADENATEADDGA